jgi:uncharacterized protein
MDSSHGTFIWNELNTHDVEAAKRFYADTVGWTYAAMPMGPAGTYWIIKEAGKDVGGIFDLNTVPDCASVPEHWLAYLSVDDVDARVKKAEAAGATVIRPPFDVPDVGRIAILRQPGGAGIGWMTPIMPAKTKE